MKAAISIPDDLFERADAEATKLGVSRSKLIQVALEQYFASRRDAALTQELNRALDQNKDFAAEDAAWADFATRSATDVLAMDNWNE